MTSRAKDSPSSPFDILVVGRENVCRSPVAEQLLRTRLQGLTAGTTYSVSSSGLDAATPRPLDPAAAAQLRALGRLPAHVASRPFRLDDVDRAGLVLTADTAVRRRVLHEAPSALRRTFTLREFAYLVPLVMALGPTSPDRLVMEACRRRANGSGVDVDVPDPQGLPDPARVEGVRLTTAAVGHIARAFADLASS